MWKEKKKKIRFGDITTEIIKAIARLPEALAGGFLDQKSVYSSLQGKEFITDRFIDNLWNLKNSGYIEIKKETNGNRSVCLTTKGRIKYLESDSDKSDDGKMRILSFDIPEDLRRVRNQFRRSIKRIGFKQLQQSLWACPYPRAGQIDIIINELGIKPYVAYFIIEKSNVEQHIWKLFEESGEKA